MTFGMKCRHNNLADVCVGIFVLDYGASSVASSRPWVSQSIFFNLHYSISNCTYSIHHMFRSARLNRFCIKRYSTPPKQFGDPHHVPPQHESTPAPPKSLTQFEDLQRQEEAQQKNRFGRVALSIVLNIVPLVVVWKYYSDKLERAKEESERQAIAAQRIINREHIKAGMLVTDVDRLNKRIQARMGLHIAMLRKQLADVGIDPVSSDKAVDEFTKTVDNITDLHRAQEPAFMRYTPQPAEYKDDPKFFQAIERLKQRISHQEQPTMTTEAPHELSSSKSSSS